MEKKYKSADVAVIGAGHAGIEAAFAAARLGLDTVLFTLSLDAVANMPCNPSIGGSGKGHLVYEIDALGGEMGKIADMAALQSRTLNTGKGAAVRSKRIQADRVRYRVLMKSAIEKEENIRLVQAEITDMGFDASGAVESVTTRLGEVWRVRAAVVASGTYLSSRVFVGDCDYDSGPDGMLPSRGLSASLAAAGIELLRFKTGTPARVKRQTIDFSQLEEQSGEDTPAPFSADSDGCEFLGGAQRPCHIVYTNERTHEIIRANLKRSAMYSGHIHGIGPRYCPSIEDKVVRFADKERHQLFVEPMGADTDEMYIQGFSTSMPPEVQYEMLRSLDGFANAEIMRYAYAIEYDCAEPTQMYPTLEFKAHSGLYGAGQFNGTSGYEEAAAQGLVAGVNAALKIKGEAPMILERQGSYIGTLIDDLVTKGTNEPYRIMTSRSEYRLLLRQDNADARLTEEGHRTGLVGEERYAAFLEKQKQIKEEIERAERTNISPSAALEKILAERDSTPLTTGTKLADLIRRPELDYEATAAVDEARPDLPLTVRECVNIEIKYKGYIDRQIREAERMRKLEQKLIPADFDYSEIKGLRIEAAQKLAKIRPLSIGQAARISGVNPADITVLLLRMKRGE